MPAHLPVEILQFLRLLLQIAPVQIDDLVHALLRGHVGIQRSAVVIRRQLPPQRAGFIHQVVVLLLYFRKTRLILMFYVHDGVGNGIDVHAVAHHVDAGIHLQHLQRRVRGRNLTFHALQHVAQMPGHGHDLRRFHGVRRIDHGIELFPLQRHAVRLYSGIDAILLRGKGGFHVRDLAAQLFHVPAQALLRGRQRIPRIRRRRQAFPGESAQLFLPFPHAVAHLVLKRQQIDQRRVRHDLEAVLYDALELRITERDGLQKGRLIHVLPRSQLLKTAPELRKHLVSYLFHGFRRARRSRKKTQRHHDGCSQTHHISVLFVSVRSSARSSGSVQMPGCESSSSGAWMKRTAPAR